MIAKYDTRHLRRAIVAHDRSSGRWTVAGLLLKLGMDAEWVRRYSSAAGRAAAKAYREATGTEPRDSLTLRAGRIRHVKGYDSPFALLIALLTYRRLATELGL